MPRFRFTIRRMMVAVAIVALASGIEVTRRRWAYCRDRAAYHRSQEKMLGGDAEVALARVDQAMAGPAASEREASHWRTEAEKYGARAVHHARRRVRYERAARYPWLPVEPDPPEPK